jgi:nuclear pore complex protein Nup93
MVGYYTGDFRAARSEVATDYLILLSLNADLPGEAGARQAEACREALRELVLETREFAQLLGDIRNDGQRVPGAIQQRANLIRRRGAAGADSVEEFIKALTIQAALAADEGGRTTDAVLLYHLASEYENVLSIVNRTLSEALTIDPGQEAMRLEPLRPRNVEGQQNQHQNSTLSLTSVDDPVVLARNMRDLYNGPVHQGAQNKIKRVTREATEVLLLMANAKALLVSGSYIQCIDVIGNIDLLPLNTRSNITVIRKYAQNLNDLTPVVARVVGDLLIWAVAACNAEKKRLTKDGWEVDARREVVENYARAIADLGVFAGLVRYKLRQGVFEILARAAEGL